MMNYVLLQMVLLMFLENIALHTKHNVNYSCPDEWYCFGLSKNRSSTPST